MLMRQLGSPRRQRGLSLVELMVGITIGLFVVAAASLVVTTQLRENRQLLLETQLQQDLRATADIIVREIRRSGYSRDSQMAVWSNESPLPVRPSDHQGVTVTAGAQGAVEFDYRREVANGSLKYELVNGVIRTRLATLSPVQDLTDKNVVFIESMTITPQPQPAQRLACPNDCPAAPPPGAGADYCWPTVTVRDLTVNIVGRSVSDASVRREVTSRVRLRNDLLSFHPDSPQGCPN